MFFNENCFDCFPVAPLKTYSRWQQFIITQTTGTISPPRLNFSLFRFQHKLDPCSLVSVRTERWSQKEVLLKINVKILKLSSGTQQNKPFSWTLLSFIFLWEICLCKIYSSNSVFLKKLYYIKYTQCINIKCCGNMRNVAWMSVEMIERKSFIWFLVSWNRSHLLLLHHFNH